MLHVSVVFFLVIKLLSKCYSGQNIFWNLRSQMLLPHESAMAEQSRIFFPRWHVKRNLHRAFAESVSGFCSISDANLFHSLIFYSLAALHSLRNRN